jgi:hypothetical protein
MADCDFSEMGPIHLTLFPWKSAQAKKRFLVRWTNTGDKSAQLDHTAGIATIANHLKNPGGPQAWMLCQNLPNEAGIRIRGTGSKRLGVVEPVGFNGKTDCLVMNPEFSGDGSDLPMLGIKPMAYLGTSLCVNQGSPP